MLIQLTIIFMVVVQTYGRVVQQFEQPQVMITQGILQGKRYQTEIGNIFHSYAGIPYAKPPIGALRLQNPLPAEGWEGVRDASSNPPKCPQFVKRKVVGEEDCLYLNVYVPEAQASTSGHAVMVFLHGGDFMAGGIEDYSPLPLMDYGVVLVVVQYRLGVLGFLSTEDSTLPGNYGLKDQTLALRWVKDNIRDFGGDPDQVTLFGQGSGAYSAHYQVLSPYAKGLFSRAILQSGTSLCPKYPLEGHASVARRVGQELGCGGHSRFPQRNLDSEDLLQCLQGKEVDQMVPVYEIFEVWNGLPFSMTPRVDGDYLPEDLTLLLASGNFSKVDVIIGMTSEEGGLMTSALYTSTHHLRELSQNFREVGPVSLTYQGEEFEEHLAAINYVYYLDNITKPISWEDADNITKMFTDRYVSVCSDFTALLHARAGVNVRMYQLTHRGLASATDKFQILFDNHWVTQDDDLQYLFSRTHDFPPLRTPKDLRMRAIMVTLWTNFAKTGDPTPDESLGFTWEHVSNKSVNYLELSPTTSMQEDYRRLLRGFWLSLPTRQNSFLFPEGIGHFEVRAFGDGDREDGAKMVFRPKGGDGGEGERPEGGVGEAGGDGGEEERPGGGLGEVGGEVNEVEKGEVLVPSRVVVDEEVDPGLDESGTKPLDESATTVKAVGSGGAVDEVGGDGGEEARPEGGVGEVGGEDEVNEVEAGEVLVPSRVLVDERVDRGLDESATTVKAVGSGGPLDESASKQTLEESGGGGMEARPGGAVGDVGDEVNVGEAGDELGTKVEVLGASRAVVDEGNLGSDESGTKTLEESATKVKDVKAKVALDESGAAVVEYLGTKVALDESGAVVVEDLGTKMALEEPGSNVNIEGLETKVPSRTKVDVDESGTNIDREDSKVSSEESRTNVDVTGVPLDESGTKMEDPGTKDTAGMISESPVHEISSEEGKKVEKKEPEVGPKASEPKVSEPKASEPKASEPERVSGVTSKDSGAEIPEIASTNEYTGEDLGPVVESLVPEIIGEDSDIVGNGYLKAEVIANGQGNGILKEDLKREDNVQKSETTTEDLKGLPNGGEREESTNELEGELNAGMKDLSNAGDIIDYVNGKEKEVHALVSDVGPSVDFDSHSEYVDAIHMQTYDTIVQAEGLGADTLSGDYVGVKAGVEGVDTDTKVAGDVGTGTQAAEDMGIDTKAADNVGIDTQAADNVGIDTQAAEGMGIDTQAAEVMGTDTQAAEGMGIDTQAAEGMGIDTQAAEVMDIDTQAAEVMGIDTQAAEVMGIDTQAADNVGTDTQAADALGTDTQAIGDDGTENPILDGVGIDTHVPDNIINDIQAANSVASGFFTQRANTIPINLPGPDVSVSIPKVGSGSVPPKKLKQPLESDFFIVKKMVDYGDLHKILKENEEMSRNYNAQNRVMSSMCDGEQC